MRFLVTAGNTREAIDRVREWGNIFTGNTGFGIARALAEVGEVDLVTSNRQHVAEAGTSRTTRNAIVPHSFTTHAELKERIGGLVGTHPYDAIFMTAAVSDYRPVRAYALLQREPDPHDPRIERWVVRDAQAGKVKSDHPQIAILGEKTEKIVDLFRSEWRYRGVLVKFKLEVGVAKEELLKIGEASRKSSGADYLVANTLEMVGGESAGAYLLWEGGSEWVARAELAGKMVRIATKALKGESKP